MGFSKIITDKNYWDNLVVRESDIDYISNILLECEKPLSMEDLLGHLIKGRILYEEKVELERQSSAGKAYLPKDDYTIGEELVFPALEWKSGKVTDIRDGKNPEFNDFKVINVEFEDDTKRQFAADFLQHELNNPQKSINEIANIDEQEILNFYKISLENKLRNELSNKKEIVRIGDTWFLKALLADFNQGHLNIIEAVLDIQSGGPLSPLQLLSQMEINLSDNQELNEFSLNYALKKDLRFDEVGTEGLFAWFLKRQEPKVVQERPEQLRYFQTEKINTEFEEPFNEILSSIDDELEMEDDENISVSNEVVSIPLIYPHWRCGTLPLNEGSLQIFPSALETERIKIEFWDEESDEVHSGWVVRPFNYVTGLEKWYDDKELTPGSLVKLEKTDKPGKIRISTTKRRSNREWMKTVLVGTDGGIVIALLKQPVSVGFQEQMAIAIPDVNALDMVWKDRSNKSHNLKSDVLKMAQELSKLNSQRHIHFTELYAVVNMIRRCPPSPILQILTTQPEFSHVGDNYFHLRDSGTKE